MDTNVIMNEQNSGQCCGAKEGSGLAIFRYFLGQLHSLVLITCFAKSTGLDDYIHFYRQGNCTIFTAQAIISLLLVYLFNLQQK